MPNRGTNRMKSEMGMLKIKTMKSTETSTRKRLLSKAAWRMRKGVNLAKRPATAAIPKIEKKSQMYTSS